MATPAENDVPRSFTNTRPLVYLACVCEKVLREEGGVLTLVRVVDTFYVAGVPEELPAKVKGGAEVWAVIGLKSGDLVGQFTIGLQVRNPTGEVRVRQEWPIVLDGGVQGATFVLRMMVEASQLGTHWIDVLWEGSERLTGVPFRLLQQQPPTDQPPTESP
ncbi:MAG TPA: hypothetical protein VNB06_05545 [Thermoanaerobaculia bacterium]|nr:hypothetical protein [Thermoanaerobaculia bacterium]